MKIILFYPKQPYKKYLLTVFALIIFSMLTSGQNLQYKAYPYLYDTIPDMVSPCIINDTVEYILVETKNNQYGIVPVTMENGEPLLYSYKVGTMMGKDQQLNIDAGDFPHLAKTGIHSELELEKKEDYRCDPIAIAFIFGLRSIEEIDIAFDGDLLSTLLKHHNSK